MSGTRSTAPELRTDPITGRPVLIAPERLARAGALLPPAQFPEDAADCPFCAGREDRTPPALFTAPGVGSWLTRVVPNQYPAVRGDRGGHEVIVECPGHEPRLQALPAGHLAVVLATYRERLRARRAEGRWRCGLLFKNHGLAAGASLSHAHSQFVALPDLPPLVAAEVAACAGACPFCALIRTELAAEVRMVAATRKYVAVAAVAGRFPFETWILPRDHARAFEDAGDLNELAGLLHDVLGRLDCAAGSPAWNLVLHTGPWTGEEYHWRLEILPRVTGIAGFELGGGMFINPVPPEDAARRLRH
jgi:UDPglucose--hexose-1-phosphate uridylyltransferase